LKIKDKREMYKLYHAGEFGNKIRSWSSYEEMINSGYQDPFSIRYRVPMSKWCKYAIPFEDAEKVMNQFISEGADPKLFEFGEMGPDEKSRVFQGEVMRSIRYYDLLWTTLGKPMRIALAEESRYDTGVKALTLVKHHFDGPSWENLNFLFDKYDGCVVEFTNYDKPMGNLNWNTVFWEVRHY
jgi:hypothetical protein